jgi:hypothetical protein
MRGLRLGVCLISAAAISSCTSSAIEPKEGLWANFWRSIGSIVTGESKSTDSRHGTIDPRGPLDDDPQPYGNLPSPVTTEPLTTASTGKTNDAYWIIMSKENPTDTGQQISSRLLPHSLLAPVVPPKLFGMECRLLRSRSRPPPRSHYPIRSRSVHSGALLGPDHPQTRAPAAKVPSVPHIQIQHGRTRL